MDGSEWIERFLEHRQLQCRKRRGPGRGGTGHVQHYTGHVQH